jgi:hypothetical protein
MTLWLWLIKQEENGGYDTFDSAVVAAHDAAEARNIHPENGHVFGQPNSSKYSGWQTKKSYRRGTWASHPSKVTATCIGEAADGVKGVVMASFNAG